MRYLILALFAVPAFAQVTDSKLSACRDQATTVAVDNPGKAKQAQEEFVIACMSPYYSAQVSTEQRRQITLMKHRQVLCQENADSDPDATAQAKVESVRTCMRGYNYIQQ